MANSVVLIRGRLRGGWSRVINGHQKLREQAMNLISFQPFPTLLSTRTILVRAYNLNAEVMSLPRSEQKRPRSSPTLLTPTRPRKRVSLRVLDSSPQCKGRLPLLDQDQQVLTPRLRLLLLILVLYPKLDPSPESLLLPGALPLV